MHNLVTASLCICLMLASCSLNEDINELTTDYVKIPDFSFESILIDLGIDSDGQVNQKMSKQDAEKIFKLDLSSLDFGAIDDFTGIEAFTNLRSLTVTRHSIEHIDLSSNRELKMLNLVGNQLINIDLSNNTNLKLVDISYNELKSIEGIPALSNLIELDLSGNLIEEIKIDNATLEKLQMTDNELITIDIAGASNVNSILLTNNNLSTLDISANKKLESLLVSGNRIASIDVSQNQDLAYLYISSNQLNSLDVSNNLALTSLKVDRNPDLDCINIGNDLSIPSVSLSNHQELSSACN